MGDRGNIIIEKSTGNPHPIYFYTHWSGSGIKETLQSALKRGQRRWTDGAYLARIIFCELVKGHEMDETGFGISTGQCDNERNFLCVDVDDQKVKEREYDYRNDKQVPHEARVLHEWTFEEFAALDLDAEPEPA